MKKIYSLMFTSYPGWTWGQTELRKLTKLLKDLEWSGTVWTDYAACPYCLSVKDGLPSLGSGMCAEKQLPEVHAATCKLAKTLKDLGVEVQIEKVKK